MANPRVLIPTGVGINSHEELAYVFRLAGADTEHRHINEIIAEPSLLDQYQGLGAPGGFMMGDQLGAGQSIANRTRHSGLLDKLREKIGDPGFPIYCVCNSLQLFAKLDLFPLPVGTVKNDSGKHETGLWDIEVNPANDSVWLKYLQGYDKPIFAPISHGEGRIYVPDDSLQEARDRNLIALTYADGYMCEFYRSSRGHRYNPNGS
ncbi:phosphoribosylformylglycinamidine synthase subunit PurQ, partial [Candidatus Woesearchaeota archaeon]|nr:phosphoribosylformylglycinamidine synthase subunit PurQ [Candidatus Woesearchaeota archaeon]